MIGEKIMPNKILISGGFDPVHSGHIKLIEDAGNLNYIITRFMLGILWEKSR